MSKYETMLELYEETEEVFIYFKSKGLKIGIISDTLPSLKNTIKALGLSKYVDTCISSSEIGTFKPDPIIFNHALKQLNVKAENSIYVDDYDV